MHWKIPFIITSNDVFVDKEISMDRHIFPVSVLYTEEEMAFFFSPERTVLTALALCTTLAKVNGVKAGRKSKGFKHFLKHHQFCGREEDFGSLRNCKD